MSKTLLCGIPVKPIRLLLFFPKHNSRTPTSFSSSFPNIHFIFFYRVYTLAFLYNCAELLLSASIIICMFFQFNRLILFKQRCLHFGSSEESRRWRFESAVLCEWACKRLRKHMPLISGRATSVAEGAAHARLHKRLAMWPADSYADLPQDKQVLAQLFTMLQGMCPSLYILSPLLFWWLYLLLSSQVDDENLHHIPLIFSHFICHVLWFNVSSNYSTFGLQIVDEVSHRGPHR